MPDVVTTVLELLGIALLVAFCWFCWPPLALAAGGAACLLVSWRLSGTPLPKWTRRRSGT